MDRFEFREGTSSKFWEIEQNGKTLSLRWGRIGASGQSKDKAFPTVALARAARERLVHEKTQEGYRAAGSSSTPESDAPAFDMRAIWARIESAAKAQGRSLRLRPAATERAILAAEKTMGLAFPPDFRASLLVHDGEEPPRDLEERFEWLPGPPLAPLSAIVAEWKNGCANFEKYDRERTPREIERGRLYDFMWHPKRIPIAGDRFWDQDNTYLDLIPGPKGTKGQVVVFGKGVFGELCGSSFGAMLSKYADALSAAPNKTAETPAQRAATKTKRAATKTKRAATKTKKTAAKRRK